MRTTLDIDDDVLSAAKELAAKEGKTAGKVLSELFRKALAEPSPGVGPGAGAPGYACKNKIPVVRSRGEIVTNAHVQRLMEEEGI